MNKLLFAAVMTACVASATPYDASSAPLIVTGSMMTPVSATLPDAGSAWSLNVADQGWGSEGYAFVTLEVAPNTKVQITGGTLRNEITGSWYWGDVVIFASAVNPASAIAGKVAGPTGSNPAPGVMAWMSDSQYDASFATATKAAANNAGYRYFGGWDGFGSYRDAIGGYSSNVENFRDGGLDINGGTYAGWNEGTAPSMANTTPARQLTEILYPAGGLNRALKDQTYAFDGAVVTSSGTENRFVTLMVRGGGGGVGSIKVDNLTVSFSQVETLQITGSMMTPVKGNTEASTTLDGTGPAWSLDVTSVGGWSEGYAYTTFLVSPNTRVQITGGTLQNEIPGSWYWGDLVIFASAVNPASAIAGKVPGPTGSNPAPGVMAYMSDSQYEASFATATKAEANNAGYRYFGGGDGFGSYRDAIGGYSSNVENFRDGGLNINGGTYAGWNEGTTPSMASVSAARPLTDILYPAGGLNRALKDQTYAFDGSVYTGTNKMYVTIMVRGGGGGGGSINVDNLTVSFTDPSAFKITGSMMTPVSSGTPTTVTGTGSAWSLNVEYQGWGSEGFAYTTFLVSPNTRVQINGGTMQNTITPGVEGWYWGDLVIFASAVNPASAIAGRVAGPTGSNPAPGVMAYMTDGQYGDPANFATKAAANNAGYRYYGGSDGFSSYRDAIGGYSSNVENFRDGGLAINGGTYVGWNEVTATMPSSIQAIRPLTDILYPAGGLNRALKDQTYAFDGTVYTGSGPGNMYITIMVRGGGSGSGSIHVNNLTVSFTPASWPLGIAPQTGNVLLSWPGDAPSQALEQTDDLQSGDWTPVTAQPSLTTGYLWTLPQPVEPGARFFRLQAK